jgi:hypothetical protein
MAAKVMSGARAKLGFYGGNQVNYIGIFADVSYGVTYNVEPVYILGSYSAVEIDYTSMDPVYVTATGFRVINHGWFADAGFPGLADLMNHNAMTISVYDRQTDTECARIEGVRPQAASGGFNAKMLSSSTHSYVGMLVHDESRPDNNDPTSMLNTFKAL